MNDSQLLFEISKNKKLGYIDKTGKVVIQTKEKASLHVANYNGGLKNHTISFKEKDKHGFRTIFGDTVLEPIYDNAGVFHEGLGLVGKYKGIWYYKGMPQKSYWWTYVNESGELVADYKYIQALPFYNGVALVKEPCLDDIHNKYSTNPPSWALIDQKGNAITTIKFEHAFQFSEGLAAVQLNGKFGYINTKGDVVIEPKFDIVSPFQSGIARVAIKDPKKNAEQYVYQKLEPHIEISPNFKGKLGLIDTNGTYILEPTINAPKLHFNSEYSDFHEGLCSFEKDDKYGFINYNGEEVIPAIYDDVGIFSEGLASIKLNNKYGFINKEGQVVIEPQFVYAWEFKEGLASVQKRVSILDEKTGKKKSRLKWGFINASGSVCIDPIFSSVSHFYDGLAMVNFEKGMGYVNKEGNIIWREID